MQLIKYFSVIKNPKEFRRIYELIWRNKVVTEHNNTESQFHILKTTRKLNPAYYPIRPNK